MQTAWMYYTMSSKYWRYTIAGHNPCAMLLDHNVLHFRKQAYLTKYKRQWKQQLGSEV